MNAKNGGCSIALKERINIISYSQKKKKKKKKKKKRKIKKTYVILEDINGIIINKGTLQY